MTEPDDLLTRQITDATNFVATSTGAALADLPRSAVVAAVRDMYNGVQQIGPNAAHHAWMDAYRSYAPPE